MAAVTSRNGTLITHNNATYIPSPLIPGFTGHVPTTKFMSGDTFGKASVKYLQDVRRASTACHASEYGKGGLLPCIYSNDGPLINMHRSQNRYPAVQPTYWSRYNVDFKRQGEIELFNELAQKHREKYKDTTGTRQPVSFFTMPVTDNEKYLCKTHYFEN
ncbi:protein FAM166C A [Ictalurus punctatus]|uniref:Ciliary microtubule inner protein 2C n=1 Tax=Ictalurus punctatus TaxID=7998 RepID=A0A2D0Q107_ICTPU|nr:protein FAM166C A [Ictalurus punctatus]